MNLYLSELKDIPVLIKVLCHQFQTCGDRALCAQIKKPYQNHNLQEKLVYFSFESVF